MQMEHIPHIQLPTTTEFNNNNNNSKNHMRNGIIIGLVYFSTISHNMRNSMKLNLMHFSKAFDRILGLEVSNRQSLR